MNSTMREIFQFIKDDQASKRHLLNEDGIQNATNDGLNETDAVYEPEMPLSDDASVEGDAVLEDPNLLLDPVLNFDSSTIEQKKIMLIDYFNKLIDKIIIVRDHIDSLSFDSVVSSGVVIGASQLQFNLEELKSKLSKYIEDQYDSDKYERSLYVYLSFMEELKLIVKLLQKQAKKLEVK